LLRINTIEIVQLGMHPIGRDDNRELVDMAGKWRMTTMFPVDLGVLLLNGHTGLLVPVHYNRGVQDIESV
jgi:hypothetical protein